MLSHFPFENSLVAFNQKDTLPSVILKKNSSKNYL